MGFPYDTADWSVVDGAMFMGWGGSAPAIYTAAAAIICVVVLWMGNRSEKAKYEDAEK